MSEIKPQMFCKLQPLKNTTMKWWPVNTIVLHYKRMLPQTSSHQFSNVPSLDLFKFLRYKAAIPNSKSSQSCQVIHQHLKDHKSDGWNFLHKRSTKSKQESHKVCKIKNLKTCIKRQTKKSTACSSAALVSEAVWNIFTLAGSPGTGSI